mgnify:CR=1 FL=1
MKINELKSICENLIDTFNIAGKKSIDLFANGLKIEIKEDKSPVSNGDLKVNELITNAAFKVYSSLPAIYSLVPSIGSISQKIFAVFFTFKSTVSSETIGIFGVSSLIFLVINSFTFRSPLLTGELSFLISIFKPLT